MRKLYKHFFLILFVTSAVGFVVLCYFLMPWPSSSVPQEYGVTWSRPYAESLGLDSDQGLAAVLDDLQVKKIRLPAYWPDVQPTWDGFEWEKLDRELDLIAAKGAKATVVVGVKQPRWPEYWMPRWAQEMSSIASLEQAQLTYVEAVIRRYAEHPAVESWQVENEPFLMFGEGRIQSREFVLREMKLVKDIELARAEDRRRPIHVTDSGELSFWLHFSGEADGLGVSVYRVVQSPLLGTIRYWFLPPWFYARKAFLLARWIGPVYVSEFQMEPWADRPLIEVPLTEQFQTMSTKQLDKNLAYAKRLQMPRVYFWGAEWWYWLKTKQNHPEFWEKMKIFLTGD